MAVAEHGFQVAVHPWLSHVADGSPRQVVFNFIAEQCACPIAGLAGEAVSVLPGCERPADLFVCEMVIPGEVDDLQLPRYAYEKVRDWAKADDHTAARPSKHSTRWVR